MSPQQYAVSAICVVAFFVGLQILRRRLLEPLRHPGATQNLAMTSLVLAGYWSLLIFLPVVVGATSMSPMWPALYLTATAAIALGVRVALRVLVGR